MAGGLLGSVLGYIIAAGVGSLPFTGVILGEKLAEEHGRIHFIVTAQSILASLAVLFPVGLVAGVLPAIRASRLDPVEALRYE